MSVITSYSIHYTKLYDSADFTFATTSGSLFGVPEVNKTLVEEVQPRYGNITNKFGHNLVAVDAAGKVATFEHKYEVQGVADDAVGGEDLPELSGEPRGKRSYNFV